MSLTQLKVVALAALGLIATMSSAHALDAKEGDKVALRGKLLFDKQWRSEGIVPYRLQIKGPLRLSGNGEVCDDLPSVKELDLFDRREAAYKGFVGRDVIVEGIIDCPRGGYVIRDFSIKIP